MNCKLCGLITPKTPIISDGHSFCCIGCREVYLHFGAETLAENSAGMTKQEPVYPEGEEAFLRIDGMHCASCEILIEHAAKKIDGIVSVVSNYATSTAKIVYNPDIVTESKLSELLSISGYRARLRGDNTPPYDERQSLFRVVTATSLASVIMMLYLAFYYPTHLGLVSFEELEPVRWLAFKAVPLAMLVLTTILVFYTGAPIFRGSLIGLRTGVLNMDNLLSIAILSAYGYSAVQFYNGSLDLYFDVAAAIITVVTVGRHFERKARMSATSELANLLEAWSPNLRIRREGEFTEIGVSELRPGEHVFVHQGEPIPVDGTIVKGEAAVDESLMTGEPFPVSRSAGDKVVGGARVVEGEIEIAVGEVVESQMDALAKILWNLQSSTSGLQGLADRIARWFVPTVLILAAAITGGAYFAGVPLEAAILTGLATLIVSCPCTFGLAIPLATAAGVSTALQHGLIVTSANIFEKKPRFDFVAIDKTGTLSTGDMAVVDVIGPPIVTEYAAAVERLSVHPVAEAIARLDETYTATDFINHPGRGAAAIVEDHQVAVGSKALFVLLGWEIPRELTRSATTILTDEGVVSYVGWDGTVHGAIVTKDRSRPEWKSLVDRLSQEARVVLLTGAEHSSGYEERVDEVFVGVPPEAKAAVIRRLKNEGTVAMIGDGSNDAPALAAADLGIAFGAPTSLAAEAADVVIPGDRLEKIFEAFRVIDTTRRRIRQNLGWALLYNATSIPLALSGHLNPLFAALAMSSSSLLVVWNSSRSIPIEEPIEHPTKTQWMSHRIRATAHLANK